MMSMPGSDKTPAERMGAQEHRPSESAVPILGVWRDSFEEAADARVFRPDDFDFPLARGRAAIEFRPDGEFVEWAIGRGDANRPIPGRWEVAADGVVRITREDGSHATVQLEGDQRLRVEDD